MLECMVVIPFLLFLALALFDCGRALNTYIAVSQIAHEGVRKGGSTFDLETGHFESSSAAATCGSGSVASPSPLTKQAGLQANTQRLLVLQDLAIDQSDICIESGRALEVAPSPGDKRSDTVFVKVETTYDGFFPLFQGLPIEVAARGPYLFADDSSGWDL